MRIPVSLSGSQAVSEDRLRRGYLYKQGPRASDPGERRPGEVPCLVAGEPRSLRPADACVSGDNLERIMKSRSDWVWANGGRKLLKRFEQVY